MKIVVFNADSKSIVLDSVLNIIVHIPIVAIFSTSNRNINDSDAERF